MGALLLSIPVSYHIMLLCCSVPCGLRKPKTSRAYATSQDGGATYLNTRSRFRYRMSLLSLPDELLLHLLKALHIKDLLSMRSVSIDVTIHQCIAILGPAIRIYPSNFSDSYCDTTSGASSHVSRCKGLVAKWSVIIDRVALIVMVECCQVVGYN